MTAVLPPSAAPAGGESPVPAEDVAAVSLSAPGAPPDPGAAADANPLRHAVAALLPVAGAGALAGGVFNGVVLGSVVGVLAGVAGGGAAYQLRRARSVWLTMVGLAAALIVIGVAAAIAVGGPATLGRFAADVEQAITQARLLRPPVDITAGFAALLAWIMGVVGFCSVWVATVLRRPAIGMVLPLAVAGIIAISIPDDLKLAGGIALLVMFAAGLGVLSGDRRATGADRTPLSFELRRAAKALPVLAVVSAAVVLLGQSGFLFPTPAISPQLEAQRPKTVPISQVPDKVLFTVKSSVTGPWVVGVLDVYNGSEWLLPPVQAAQLVSIPSSGVVDPSLKQGIVATFTIAGLTGAVLPGLPNTVAIRASGPTLDYDARSDDVRLVDGEITSGFTYQVAAQATPTITTVEKDNAAAPPAIERAFTAIPAPPPAVQALLKQAPKTSRWQEFDFLRTWVLQNVTASGLGTPVAVPPDRVQQVIGVTKEASPFEIVAIQAMLARWMNLPSRIAYGFDGGVKTGGHLEVHPKNGAAFPEVYFNNYGWLPVIGTPTHAQISNSTNSQYQVATAGVQPSGDIATPLFLPVALPGAFQWTDLVRDVAGIAAAVAVLLLLVYFGIPVVRKAVIRYRRRNTARALGARARVVEAYVEWRDTLLDYGYAHSGDTPLMLTQRFAPDDEHAQLAWLVTRALWGDLKEDITDDLATDAEELSRSLQRRLALAHPLSVRLVAAVSRRSLRAEQRFDVDVRDIRGRGTSSGEERRAA